MSIVFSHADIERRFSDMHHLMADFCEAYVAETKCRVFIDVQLLFLTVVAIYDDIARYKAYHLSDPVRQRANSIKRAAYGAKWLVRFNPIIVEPKENAGFPSHDGLINAKFAVFFAVVNLQERVECILGQAPVNIMIDDELSLDMIYDILYRNLGGEPLMLVLEVLSDVSSGKNVISIS